MVFLNLFGSTKKNTTRDSSTTESININKIISDSDKALAEMWKADETFKKDGDIEKRIEVYEKFLRGKPLWNSFNFNLKLANMYVKAGRNNQAWSYLNQLYLWSLDPDAVGLQVSKIRFEQFKILKAEKKFEDAFIMIVSSYVLNAYDSQGMYFNKEKFKKDAKTTVKGIGLSEGHLNSFADKLERDIKGKKISESKIKEYCRVFLY